MLLKQANGISSIKRYNYKTNLNWTSNNTLLSRQQLFYKVTYSFQEIIKSISIRYMTKDEKGEFFRNLGLNEIRNLITEQRHRGFGRCYTFYPETYMRNLGIYYIKLAL